MRSRTLLFALLASASLASSAQYGSYDKEVVAAAKPTTLLVVLDDGDSPWNRTLIDAVKAHWKFNAAFDFIHLHDLAVAPVAADKCYLMKMLVSDPEKHDGTYLTLVRGWKQKKGEALETKDGAVTNLPTEQVLAYLLCDPAGLETTNSTMLLNVYVKCLQDFLKQVEKGKITDRTTADRLYQSRNRLVRDDMSLYIAKEHLANSLPDATKVKEFYTHTVEVRDLSAVLPAVEEQNTNTAVTDVVMTGSYREKWCYKRIFNAGTGELMYVKDEAALFGKKEGFYEEDLKTVERAR